MNVLSNAYQILLTALGDLEKQGHVYNHTGFLRNLEYNLTNVSSLLL